MERTSRLSLADYKETATKEIGLLIGLDAYLNLATWLASRYHYQNGTPTISSQKDLDCFPNGQCYNNNLPHVSDGWSNVADPAQ
jgi:hypothetical protein